MLSYKYFAISAAMSAVRKFLINDGLLWIIRNIFPKYFLFHLEYLLMGEPSGPMRNFSKFQAMSVLLTGRQIRNWGLAIRLSGSSLGAGRDFFRNLNTGCSFSPLASTYQPRHFMSSHLKQEKALPCQTILLWTQTHFQAWHASEHWQFLVLQNFLGGQTNIITFKLIFDFYFFAVLPGLLEKPGQPISKKTK